MYRDPEVDYTAFVRHPPQSHDIKFGKVNFVWGSLKRALLIYLFLVSGRRSLFPSSTTPLANGKANPARLLNFTPEQCHEADKLTNLNESTSVVFTCAWPLNNSRHYSLAPKKPSHRLVDRLNDLSAVDDIDLWTPGTDRIRIVDLPILGHMLLARSDFGGEFVPSPGHGDPIRPPEPLHFSGLLPWKICLTILHCCGISSSLFRILHRFFSRSAWWDDYVAIVPFVAEILHCAMLWMFKNQGVGPISRKPFSFWLSTVVYLLQLWSSRVCLALSLARVIPDGQLTRKLAFHIAAAFALGGAGMLVGRVAACVPRTESGSAKQSAQCIMHSGLAIAGFTVDIIADLVLVACALISLWNVKLPKNERRLILSVFSASALTCIVAIVYMMLVLSPLNRPPMGPIYMAMMPHIEASPHKPPTANDIS
ncbi:hypothetical protein AX16_010462 [Volvariella volvacea WC 439]|nr:hypothetical protein AX16_010462 [Volvariella volvacea WC 439]